MMRILFFSRISTLFSFWFLVASWEILRYVGKSGSSVLPSSYAILQMSVLFVQTDRFWEDVLATTQRALGGFFLAAIAGISIGLAVGRYPVVAALVLPLIDFCRSIPVTTLYPVFVLVLGIGDASKLTMVFFCCFFIIALNTAYGVASSNPIRSNVASLFGASGWHLFWHVSTYEALPQIFVGLRVAISLAFIISILVEMFMGAKFGIGQRVMEFYSIYDTVSMYSYIFFSGVLGFVLNRLFSRIETHALHWVSKH